MRFICDPECFMLLLLCVRWREMEDVVDRECFFFKIKVQGIMPPKD